MVAFDLTYPRPLDSTIDFVRREASSGSAASHHAGRRAARSPVVVKRHGGKIAEVRIGPWRVLAATDLRRIADVRELSAGRTAVLIERSAAPGGPLTSILWQLYDAGGRLTAATHSNPDQSAALMMNYQTREACRTAVGADGEQRTVAQWKF
ncbi:MAG: hypothetical protein KDA44_07690 [Planctomycetales bacterium]|nr:hypothetical protein [Planctomycetales bacterium]